MYKGFHNFTAFWTNLWVENFFLLGIPLQNSLRFSLWYHDSNSTWFVLDFIILLFSYCAILTEPYFIVELTDATSVICFYRTNPFTLRNRDGKLFLSLGVIGLWKPLLVSARSDIQYFISYLFAIEPSCRLLLSSLRHHIKRFTYTVTMEVGPQIHISNIALDLLAHSLCYYLRFFNSSPFSYPLMIFLTDRIVFAIDDCHQWDDLSSSLWHRNCNTSHISFLGS